MSKKQQGKKISQALSSEEVKSILSSVRVVVCGHYHPPTKFVISNRIPPGSLTFQPFTKKEFVQTMKGHYDGTIPITRSEIVSMKKGKR